MPVSSRQQDVTARTTSSDLLPSDHLARTAVLNTNERLHHVLLQLPVEDRERVRRVSKTWNAVITKVGYTISPAAIHANDYDEYPIYPTRMNIRLNPIITEDSILRVRPSSGWKRMTTARVPWRYSEKLREFLTYPPITQVSVRYRPLAYGAAIRVRDGVRVGDVVKVLAKMRRLAPRNLGPHRPEPIAV